MFNNDVKIAFFGTSVFSLIVLKELQKSGIIPDLIVTTPDKPKGRKLVLTPTPTKFWAEENSIECIEPADLSDKNFIKKIKDYDLFIVGSYGKIIPKTVLDLPKYKILNIHPSLLPKYRGPSPIQTQILNDEKNIGVSIMFIDERVDHGAVIAQKKVDVPLWPVGFLSLQEILAKAGANLLSEILTDWVKGKIKPIAQNDSEATFTKKIDKLDGYIDISKNDYKNFLKYLAYEEWPKTHFIVDTKDKKIKVTINNAKWTDKLDILEVTPEGRWKMNYKDFVKGLNK